MLLKLIQDVGTILLNGIPPAEFIAFMIIGSFGVILSKAVLIWQIRDDITNSDKSNLSATLEKFKKEVPRMILGIGSLIIVVLFSDTFLGTSMNLKLACLSGLGIDQLIDSISSKKSKIVQTTDN